MDESKVFEMVLCCPMFEYILTIPLPVIKKYVKNKNEAVVLLEISNVGSNIDILLRHFSSILKQAKVFNLGPVSLKVFKIQFLGPTRRVDQT